MWGCATNILGLKIRIRKSLWHGTFKKRKREQTQRSLCIYLPLRDCVDRMEIILCSDEINYRDRETQPVPKLVLRTEKNCRYSPAATLIEPLFIIIALALVRQTIHQQQPSHRLAVTLWSSSSCPVWIWDLLLTLTTPTSILQKVTWPAQKLKQLRSSGGSRRAELRLDLCLCDSKPLRQLAG